MDKIEQFIKKNKGCPLTPAATKQLLTKFMEYMSKELPGMIEEGSGTSLKSGYFIWKDENETLVNVEELPEDYQGFCIQIDYNNDVIRIGDVENQAFQNAVNILSNHIIVNDGADNQTHISGSGVDKLDFASLTHSFNELDTTLKQIVEDAIADDWTDGVDCSEAQWSAIKLLLDKSLYLNYNGYSLIKTYTDGIDNYMFGNTTANTGAIVEFGYVSADNILFANFSEV